MILPAPAVCPNGVPSVRDCDPCARFVMPIRLETACKSGMCPGFRAAATALSAESTCSSPSRTAQQRDTSGRGTPNRWIRSKHRSEQLAVSDYPRPASKTHLKTGHLSQGVTAWHQPCNNGSRPDTMIASASRLKGTTEHHDQHEDRANCEEQILDLSHRWSILSCHDVVPFLSCGFAVRGQL